MYKRFCRRFAAVMLSLLAAVAGCVVAVDPFTHYHAPEDYTKIIYQMPCYQNVGIAKNAEFDTLITGSSMVQNFRADWFDATFGCRAIRLAFELGSIEDFSVLLDVALEDNKIKTVYWGLDNYVITGDSELLKSSSQIPGYLVDNNIFNDVKYIFNKDVIFTYVRNWISYKRSDNYSFYDMHAWDAYDNEFSKERALDSYSKLRVQQRDYAGDDCFKRQADKVSKIIMQYVVNNPDTQFVFFAPPYSILYWDEQQRKGTLNSTLNALESVYSELFKCENVTLYYFQNAERIITNLDNYKDYSHYSTDINRYMLECFTSEEFKISKRNLSETLTHMRETAESFNYDSILDE